MCIRSLNTCHLRACAKKGSEEIPCTDKVACLKVTLRKRRLGALDVCCFLLEASMGFSWELRPARVEVVGVMWRDFSGESDKPKGDLLLVVSCCCMQSAQWFGQ